MGNLAENNRVYLKALRPSKSLNRNTVCTFDTETKDGLEGCQMYCWSFAYPIKSRSKYVKTVDKVLSGTNYDFTPILEYLQAFNLKSNTYRIIYCHNLYFDWRFIVDFFERLGFKGFLCKSGSFVISYSINKLKVKFIDSVQFLRESQENAEISWNVPEKYRKIDCSRIFNKKYSTWSNEEKKRVILHNKNDVLALRDIMVKFRNTVFEVAKVDCTSIISPASLAMKCYRVFCYKENSNNKIFLNPVLGYKGSGKTRSKFVQKAEYEFIRGSYYGGRVEVIDKNLLHDIDYFDKNSMFSYVMYSQKFPTGNPNWISDKNTLNSILNGSDGRMGFIYAHAKAPKDEKYPILPIRWGTKVLFTKCSISGVWSTPELIYAKKRGYSITPVKGLIFPNSEFLFRKHISNFYSLKKNADESGNTGKKKVFKIFLNGLYGKFGQRIYFESIEFERFYDEIAANERMDELETKLGFEGHVKLNHNVNSGIWILEYRKEAESRKDYQNITLATFTTAYARIELTKEADMLWDNHQIETKYFDSDSLSIEHKYANRLKIGYELGQMKIETHFEKVKFLAPKAYIWQSQTKNKQDSFQNIKLKGCPKRKLREMERKAKTITEIEELARARIKDIETYDTFNHAHHHGYIIGTRQISKHFTFENNKRQFFDDGKSEAWNDETLPDGFRKGFTIIESIRKELGVIS